MGKGPEHKVTRKELITYLEDHVSMDETVVVSYEDLVDRIDKYAASVMINGPEVMDGVGFTEDYL